jgi:cytochrome c oxidase subunit 3
MTSQCAENSENRLIVARIGMMIFLLTEAMMFITLIAAYVVLRFGSLSWPSPGTPHLPVVITSINTVILIASSFFLHQAGQKIKNGDQKGLTSGLAWTVALGTVFLVIQGYEWLHLIGKGLTLKNGAFASCFFTITGFHGLHVLIGVLVLAVILILSMKRKFNQNSHSPVVVGGMYWHFVDIVWILIFASLYLI